MCPKGTRCKNTHYNYICKANSRKNDYHSDWDIIYKSFLLPNNTVCRKRYLFCMKIDDFSVPCYAFKKHLISLHQKTIQYETGRKNEAV